LEKEVFPFKILTSLTKITSVTQLTGEYL